MPRGPCLARLPEIRAGMLDLSQGSLAGNKRGLHKVDHDGPTRIQETEMPGRKTLEEHGRLMGQMADRLGVDLDEAELRGDLPPEQRSDMVLSCTNCTSPEDCSKWLESHDKSDVTPEYCRNGALLKDLRDS